MNNNENTSKTMPSLLQRNLRAILHTELDKALDKLFEAHGEQLSDIDMRIRNDFDVYMNGEDEETIYTTTYVEVLADKDDIWFVEDRNIGGTNQPTVEF